MEDKRKMELAAKGLATVGLLSTTACILYFEGLVVQPWKVKGSRSVLFLPCSLLVAAYYLGTESKKV